MSGDSYETYNNMSYTSLPINIKPFTHGLKFLRLFLPIVC